MSILGTFVVPHPPIILPEVGHGEEVKIKATTEAYRETMRQAAALKPDTVIITSPHSIMYADYFHISPGAKASGNFAAFRAPQLEIEVTYDQGFVSALAGECEKRGISAGTLGEKNPFLDHGTLIPLRFLGEFTSEFNLVRIGLSLLLAPIMGLQGIWLAMAIELGFRGLVFLCRQAFLFRPKSYLLQMSLPK